jgi:hypothetical protein
MVAFQPLALLLGLVIPTQGPTQDPRLQIVTTIPTHASGYELLQIRSVSRASAGDIAVLQGGEPFLLLFGRDGHFLRAVGRKGSGPGEFQAPRVIGRRADSLWIWDSALARITVFDSNGEFRRTIMLPIAGQGTLLNDGRVTVHTVRNYSNIGPKRNFLSVRPIDQVHSRAELPMYNAEYRYGVLQYQRDGASMVGIQPFEDGPLFVAVLDGSGFILVNRDVRAGAKPAFTVEKIGTHGESVFSVRVPYRPQAVTERHLKAAVGFLATQGPPTTDPGLERAIRAAIRVPGHLPPVTSINPGADGTIWLRREESTAMTVLWTVLSPSGDMLFDIPLDKRISPLAATRSGFWTVRETEDGAESLVLLSIR